MEKGNEKKEKEGTGKQEENVVPISGEGKSKKKNRTRQYILILYAVVAIALSCTLLYMYNKEIDKMPFAPKPYHFIATAVLLILFIPLFVYLNYLKETEEEFYDGYYIYLRNYLNLTEDVIDEMRKNNKEIREYFKITKRQERISYVISIACAVVGVVILLSSACSIFKNGSVEATLISVISGAITEVVSGIVLWIHNKSAMQLNYYYDALHENEKFLSAINLADKLENGKREQMYEEIIKAQIRAREENKENEKIGVD